MLVEYGNMFKYDECRANALYFASFLAFFTMFKRFFSKLVKLAVYGSIAGLLGLVFFAWRASDPILRPYSSIQESGNPDAGMKLEYFTVIGADGVPIKACLASAQGEKSRSPRQSRVLDIIKSRGKMKNFDAHAGLVIISTAWDEGILNSMNYAESLTSAGYDCLLWEPRGTEGQRKYCSYGHFESQDVPLLLDAAEKKRGSLGSVAAVGRGFGASLLTLAAVKDKRIRSVVNIDSFGALKTVISRDMEEEVGKTFAFPSFWLIDWALSARAGYSSFDVTPVEAVRSFKLPMMFVCSEDYFFSRMNDVVSMYGANPNELKILYSRRKSGEKGETREYSQITKGKKDSRIEEKYTVNLYDGDDDLMACVAEWIEDNTQQPLPNLLPKESGSN